MHRVCHIIIGLCCLLGAVPAHASDSSDLELALRGVATVAPAIIGPQRASVMATAAATIVNHADVKGEFGEALARSQRLLGLQGDGKYVSVPPRSTRQGIDVLLLGVDGVGRPNGKVLVVESKFAKSLPKLGMTKDGFQSSRTWVARRLERIAGDLARVARATGSVASSQVQMPKGAIQVALPNGKRGWVQISDDRILTDLTEAELRTAQERAGLQFRAIRSAIRTGRIDSKVMWVQPENGGYRVTVADVPRNMSPSRSPKVDTLPRSQSIFLRASDFAAAEASIAAIAKDLQRKSPHLSKADCKQIARDMFDQGKAFHETVEMSRLQQWGTTARMAGFSAAVPIALALGTGVFGALTGDDPDWGRLAVDAGQGALAAAVGTASGIVVTSLAVEQPVSGRGLASLGQLVGLRPLPSFRIAGGVTGGAIASVAFASIQFWSGDIDGRTALVLSGVGIGTSVVVGAAEAAALAMVASYATASSGAAISSLSGIAATKASMAWLGGGALSAGGFGMAGGAIVLTAGGAAVAIVAGWAFISAYQTWEASAQLESLAKQLAEMSSDWDRVLSASPIWRQVNIP